MPSSQAKNNEHYELAAHRGDNTKFEEVQTGNAQWWTDHTMSYDWAAPIKAEKYSLEWFEAIDQRFIRDSRLYGHDKAPFDRLIPFKELAGKKVLEIGCGMGYHTELLVRCGAQVRSVDISETSVKATRERLKLKNLLADVVQGDAENLPVEAESMDYVWSWGVIHHSSRTARIVREIARVLNDKGACGIMVYNRDGASAWRALVKYHCLMLGAFRGRSFDEALNKATDGFHARFYTKDQFEDLFRAYFQTVECSICGQVPDSLPLPRRIRGVFEKLVSETWLKKAQTTRGSFLFLRASGLY